MKHKLLVSAQSSRSGVTLTEVLVVIGVISLLMALLLPAVQSVRVAARQVECKNRLHQIGIAMHHFHERRQQLPVAGHVMQYLLSDVDQAPLAEIFNDVGVKIVTPAVYLCPADPLAEADKAKISYFLNGGSVIPASDANIGDNGAFQDDWHKPLSFRDFTDGLSTTALFSERLARLERLNLQVSVARQNPLRCFWETDREYLPGEERELVAWCQDVVNQQNAPLANGVFGLDTLRIEGSWYNHLSPPNNWSFSNGGYSYKGPYPPTSLHPGGVNVLMVDGAVRFISNSIGLEVWWALGTRASGDPVGEY